MACRSVLQKVFKRAGNKTWPVEYLLSKKEDLSSGPRICLRKSGEVVHNSSPNDGEVEIGDSLASLTS